MTRRARRPWDAVDYLAAGYVAAGAAIAVAVLVDGLGRWAGWW